MTIAHVISEAKSIDYKLTLNAGRSQEFAIF